MFLVLTAQRIDRRIKGILRLVDPEQVSKLERELVRQVKIACNEIRLDVRDYEYAETREEQIKWMKIARHNIRALEGLLLELGDIFGPADMAELGAQLEMLKQSIT